MSEPTRHVSKTGGAKDLKIERYDQIPAGPLAELAARYGVGSLKYPQVNGLDNWRNGYPWSWSYRALLGHANAFWYGEDVDPDAYKGTDDEDSYTLHGEPRPGTAHLAAVAWHAFALLEWAETHPELDDRPSTVVKRNEAGLAPTEDGPDGQRAADFESGWKAALRHVGETDDAPAPLTEWAKTGDEAEFWKSPLGTPSPELSEEIRDAIRKRSNWAVTLPDPKFHGSTCVAEDGKVYPLLELYQTVTVNLDDGRVIKGAITGIKVVDEKVRYDVTYGGGLGRLSFVPPAQIVSD